MQTSEWLAKHADRTLKRLLIRLEQTLIDDLQAEIFIQRSREHFPKAFALLHTLYGDQYDFFYHLEKILTVTAQQFMQRKAELKALDERRLAEPLWFQSEKMMGGVCYVDLFAGTLQGVREKIPYFQELGLTYLHLMPLYKTPTTNNDGGYAVSSFSEVNPTFGTMAELSQLAAELREHGISLVLDFVFNHTSDEHEWAHQALQGSEFHQELYLMFPDRTLPDQYEPMLREIFPDQAPGTFTYRPEIDKWVWTTFYNFQWDLNYRNPATFAQMLTEMLFLANQGVEVLRLDAVPFIWKALGTTCENLPETHLLIQAFNALVKIAAPAMLFKSEAIVHPDDVASFISWEECPISYNPTMMALLWEALATREVKLLRHSMVKRFDLPANTTWVNYVRSHDDIGWSFADEDASEVRIYSGFDHRRFLNAFYTGEFEGSFAAGVPFNFNPRTLDMRISGTTASLAGLETALKSGEPTLIDYAIKRILLIHSVILSAGGIPLIFFGDEIGTLNDFRYTLDPIKADDSRWVHRPFFDWERAAQRQDRSTIPGCIFSTLQRLIQIRKNTPAFAAGKTSFFDTQNKHVLGYIRSDHVLVLANFSDQEQMMSRDTFAPPNVTALHDLVTDDTLYIDNGLTLSPYQFVWLQPTTSA